MFLAGCYSAHERWGPDVAPHTTGFEMQLGSVAPFCETRVRRPTGPRCHSTAFCNSCNFQSVKQGQISFHTLAFLTLRWQLLSWHMCIMLLSTILAVTADREDTRRIFVTLCDWQKDIKWKDQSESNFQELRGIYWGQVNLIFSHIHFTWSLVSNTFIMFKQQTP